MKNLLSLLLFSTLYINSSLQAQIIHISEDFNASSLPSGWTTTAVSGSQSWSFGINASAALAGNSNINGTALAFFDDDVLGGTSLNNTADLLTPTFDNSSFTKTFLEFDYNFYEFNQAADSFMVDVYDGSSWNRVFSRSTNDCGRWTLPICNNNFPRALIDISSFNNANCQVRFRYFDGNDWSFSVGIDNIEIYSPYPFNLVMKNVIAPFSNCGLSSADSVKILIQNTGTNPISNFRVFADIDNGAQFITDSLSITIAPDSSYLHTFSSTVNLSSIRSYNFQTYIRSIQDTVLIDDTLKKLIINDTAIIGNYFENFETPNHGWTVSGTNNSWAWGVPSGTLINSAYSGNNAFVTNLNGRYNNNELSYLTSPCFNLSTFNNDPIVSFRLNRLIENSFDFLWLEYSINGGSNWRKVIRDTNQFVSNWYNNQTANAWDGSNNSWLQVENRLRNFGGIPGIKFRFVFQTDNSTTFEGAAIDNFGLTESQTEDLSLIDILTDNIGPKDCGPAIAPIAFTASNRGLNPIDTTYTFFQVNGGTIFNDTIIKRINPGESTQLETKTSFNFIPAGNYVIKLWVKVPNDSISYNDTLFSDTIQVSGNSIKLVPYQELFDNGHLPDDTTFNSLNDSLGNGWKRETNGQPTNSNNFEYSWRVRSVSTASFGTGPSNDVTGGNFIYTESSLGQNGDTASLISPCIYIDDTIQNPFLSFYYHRYGTAITPLNIDIYSIDKWIPIDTIFTKPQTSESDPFRVRNISLSSFKNQVIRIRFRTTNLKTPCCRGDMAIDAISVKEGKLVSYINESNNVIVDSCNADRLYPVETKIYNPTPDTILSGTIQTYYSINGVNSQSDTIMAIILPDSTFTHTYSQIGDFSAGGLTELKTIIDYPNNPNFLDTAISSFKVMPKNLPIHLDFEDLDITPIPSLCLYTLLREEYYRQVSLSWFTFAFSFLSDTNICTTNTKPKTGSGLLDARRIGDFSIGCISLKNYSQVTLEYSFFRIDFPSTNTDTSVIAIYTDSMARVPFYNPYNNTGIHVDSLIGSYQTSMNDSFITRTVDLSQFIGQDIRITFFPYNVSAPTIARTFFDDIKIYDPTVTNSEGEPVQKNNLLLYPNPNNGSFQIEIGKDLIGEEYYIYNLNGQSIRSGNFKNRNELLDISNEKAGIYFLQVPNKGIHKKVVVY